MTRNRWDETRALIEAGWHSGWGGCGDACEFARHLHNYCAKFGCIKAAHLSEIDWDNTKQAQNDAERQIYGGMFSRHEERE